MVCAVRGVHSVHLRVGRLARLGAGVPRLRLPSQEKTLLQSVGRFFVSSSPKQSRYFNRNLLFCFVFSVFLVSAGGHGKWRKTLGLVEPYSSIIVVRA